MSIANLTTNELLEVSGLHRNVLEKWIRERMLTPMNGAAGSGRYRAWSPIQVTAVTYAAAVGRGDPVARTEGYAALVARFVAGHSVEELEVAFAEGRRVVVLVGEPRLIAPPPGVRLPPHLDLARTYRRVLQRLGALAPVVEDAGN